ncbi:uncharacterized protein LOC132171453 [Corylus avellana]|uniref:uncharacterized protein LOC132171453 n=1 Tax=Corylus avellana TaxID=13451 RepID=UPI00286D528B|nr:uncharacterized protein LOC132171453 [Corylus avellana]
MNNNESNEYGEYVGLSKALRRGELNAAMEFFMLRPDAVNAKITLWGQTALHIAVAAGHLHIVEELIGRMSEEALEIKDYQGVTALFEALFIGNYSMAKCMLSKNKKLVSIGNSANVLPVVQAISSGYIELTRYLYSLTPLEDLTPEKGVNGASLCTQAIYTRSLGIEHLYEMKLISAQCHELMHHMCEQISNSNLQQRVKGGVYAAIFCAIKNGIFEFVFDVVKANSELLRSFDRDSRTIFSTAVLYRQAKIFSLIYGLEAKNLLTYYSDVHGNHILHMAGMSAASTLINRIPGAALQMQRELQWFKMVEGTSVAQHLNECNTITNQLSFEEVDFDDEICVLIVLASLPNSWVAMRMAVRNYVGKSKLRHEDIRDLILSEEVRKTDADETPSSSSTLNL